MFSGLVVFGFRKITDVACNTFHDLLELLQSPLFPVTLFCCAAGHVPSLLQELLKDSIQVLRQKCESMIAEVEAFESGVDFDEAMP